MFARGFNVTWVQNSFLHVPSHFLHIAILSVGWLAILFLFLGAVLFCSGFRNRCQTTCQFDFAGEVVCSVLLNPIIAKLQTA